MNRKTAKGNGRKWGKAIFRKFAVMHANTAYKAILAQIDRIRQFLDENKNLETLEKERDRLDKLRDAFNEAQEAYDQVVDREEDKQASYQCLTCATGNIST